MTGTDLFASGAELPAYLQGELDDVTKAIIGSSGGTGGKRISIKGSVFRQIIDGKEVQVNEDRALNLVIVNTSAEIHRTYYAAQYKEGEFQAPQCWSENGTTPHEKAIKPQSNACATCEQNIAGSGNGNSRACRYSRRIAVVLEGDISGDVYAMSLPATSLFGKGEPKKLPFEAYARYLGGNKVPVTAVVTEARFDPNSTGPKLTFRAIKPLEPEEWAKCSEQKETPDALQAVAVPNYADWGDTGDDPETQKASPKKAAGPKKRTTISPAPIEKNKIESTLEGWDD